MRPSAKTFLKDILIMIPLLYLIIYLKDKLIFIWLKDFVEKFDTPLWCYSDICIYLMKFLSREIGVLHPGGLKTWKGRSRQKLGAYKKKDIFLVDWKPERAIQAKVRDLQ